MESSTPQFGTFSLKQVAFQSNPHQAPTSQRAAPCSGTPKGSTGAGGGETTHAAKVTGALLCLPQQHCRCSVGTKIKGEARKVFTELIYLHERFQFYRSLFLAFGLNFGRFKPVNWSHSEIIIIHSIPFQSVPFSSNQLRAVLA